MAGKLYRQWHVSSISKNRARRQCDQLIFLFYFLVCFFATCAAQGRHMLLNVSDKQIVPKKSLNILALTATVEFKHTSISTALNFLQRVGVQRGWKLHTAERIINYEMAGNSLADIDVVVFVLTTGEIFSLQEKASFEKYVRMGGAVAGIHSAVDTMKSWKFYTDLVGAVFSEHPPIQTAELITKNNKHVSTGFLPKRWTMKEEFYNYVHPLRTKRLNVLVEVDETSYNGGRHGLSHPISWSRLQVPTRSRVWITTIGHLKRSYTGTDQNSMFFQRHIVLGIEWAANGTEEARDVWEQVQRDLEL